MIFLRANVTPLPEGEHYPVENVSKNESVKEKLKQLLKHYPQPVDYKKDIEFEINGNFNITGFISYELILTSERIDTAFENAIKFGIERRMNELDLITFKK